MRIRVPGGQLGCLPLAAYPSRGILVGMDAKTSETSASEHRTKRRGRGEGSIYLHGHRWMARWIVDGKLYKRSTGETSKREALKKLADFTAPFRAHSETLRMEAVAARLAGAKAEEARLADAARHKILVSGLADAYAASVRRGDCAPATLARYRRQIGEFSAFMAVSFPSVVEMRDVCPEHAEAFLRTRRDSAAGTFNKRVVLLRNVWKVLGREAGTSENPWLDIAKRKSDTVSRRALSEDELRRVLGAASGEWRTLILVGLFTGLRLGDAATLDWATVNLAAGTIRLRPRKTARTSGQTVEIPVLPELSRVLNPHLAPTPERGPVMPEVSALYERGPSLVVARLRKMFRSAGIEIRTASPGSVRARSIVGFHSLRHTFVTLCALRGVPITVVQGIVGHSTPKMTEYYAHADRETARREISRALGSLGRALGAPGASDGINPPQKQSSAPTRDIAALLSGIADGTLSFSAETPEPGMP